LPNHQSVGPSFLSAPVANYSRGALAFPPTTAIRREHHTFQSCQTKSALASAPSSHGAGTYALPGGHLEFGESPEACAAREILEETGLEVKNVRFLTATNDILKKDKKHYITMFMVCERASEKDEARVMEPDKCEGWEWSTWEELVALVKREREVKEGEVLERTLFQPLLDLVEQRPGVIPTL
jgi:8-oxo-dGTP diphosphatase